MYKQIIFLIVAAILFIACTGNDTTTVKQAADSIAIKHNTDATHPDTTLNQIPPVTTPAKNK